MEPVAFEIASLLQPYKMAPIQRLGSQTNQEVGKIVERVCDLVVESEMVAEDIAQLMPLSGILANLAAMTRYKTTDFAIRKTRDLNKIMFLYTARNNVAFNQRVFFEHNPKLASLWFACYTLPVVGMTNSALEYRLISHYRDVVAEFVPQAMWAINLSNYVSHMGGGFMKTKFNGQIQRALKTIGVKVNNKPDPTRIAVITGAWPHPAKPFVDALAKHYKVTLFHCTPTPETDLYETVQIQRADIPVQLLNNSFKFALHLDPIGSPELLQIANLRVAPVQATIPARPFSTYGTKIDLFITGNTAFTGDEFTERIVTIPGPGLPVLPIDRPTSVSRDDGTLLVGLVCNSLCYTYRFLSIVKYFVEQHPSVQLVIAPGRDAHRQQATYSVLTDLVNMFGKRASFIPYCEESELIRNLSSLDFVLDTWDFSDFQAISTVLQLGKPVVTLNSRGFSAEVTKNLLCQYGFDWLVARDVQEYLSLCSDFVFNRKRLDNAKDAVYNTKWEGTTPDQFVEAVTKIMATPNPTETYEILDLT
ncbi:MAG: hypothetical protein AMXMBFR16_10640 [Candidatus Uhrbacteria bacterium]